MYRSARFFASVRSTALLAALLSCSAPTASAATPPRVDPQLGFAVSFQVSRAAARLAVPACAAVLDEFEDVATHLPLSRRLEVLGMSPADFLAQLWYRKAPSRGPCEKPGILAYTSPGSFVIWVCPVQYQEIQRRDEALAATVLIHETLHALGLGENPPTPAEINARVFARCGR